MIKEDTPIWQLSVREFRELIRQETNQAIKAEPATEKQYVYGIDGIARLFDCSRMTAQRIKNSGKIDKAIKQAGRKIIVDANLALELIPTKN